MRDRFSRVFGRPGELERLGSVERGREADFSSLFGMGLERMGIRRFVGGKRARGEPTPLRADFAAKLALALCLPPMGAVDESSQHKAYTT